VTRLDNSSVLIKRINSQERSKDAIRDFEDYEELYEKYVREAEKFYLEEINKLSNKITEDQMFQVNPDVSDFEANMLLAFGAFVFTQAAELAYSKMTQAAATNEKLISDLAGNYMRERGATLVTGITEQSRNAIRNTVGNGMRDGVDIKEIALRIKQNIGLDERSSMAVENLRNNLTSKGVSKVKVQAQVKQYSEKLLQQRAELIAQTETAAAIENAKLGIWKSSGVPQYVRWVTDANACDKCAPSAGDIQVVGQMFQTSIGLFESPPLHPRCRCQLYLVKF